MTPTSSYTSHPIRQGILLALLQNKCRFWPLLVTMAATPMVQSTIISHLGFCNSLLPGLPASMLAPCTTSILQAMTKIIFLKILKSDYIPPLLSAFQWLPTSLRKMPTGFNGQRTPYDLAPMSSVISSLTSQSSGLRYL